MSNSFTTQYFLLSSLVGPMSVQIKEEIRPYVATCVPDGWSVTIERVHDGIVSVEAVPPAHAPRTQGGGRSHADVHSDVLAGLVAALKAHGHGESPHILVKRTDARPHNSE